MNIDDITIKQAREIAAFFNLGAVAAPAMGSPWEIGKSYLIRTVTMIDTGILVGVTEHELVIEEAAWVADTGRFADAFASASFGEVEPFPVGKVIIGRGSIVDAVQIKLVPRSQK